jgi:hypothetical protein
VSAIVPPQPPHGAEREHLERQLEALDRAIADAHWHERRRLRHLRKAIQNRLETGHIPGAIH